MLVCNRVGLTSFFMVIGALEWSFCSETGSPLQGSGAGLHIDNGLSQNGWCGRRGCVGGGACCLKWFEESCLQQVGEASSLSPPSCSPFYLRTR